MTTVVYNHEEKEIGIDSRCTMGNYIESDNYMKMKEKDGVKFFLCGDVSDIEMIVECYPNEIKSRTNVHGFILIKDLVKYLFTYELKIKEVTQYDSLSVGSGSSFAIAALDLGKTTEEAIEYAFTRDNGSGGKIRIYKTNEKI